MSSFVKKKPEEIGGDIESLIERARRKSSRNLNPEFKVSALCFDKRGRLLGIANNMSRFMHCGGGVHAEINALQKWGISINKMIVLRFGRSGVLRPIEPCENCARVLKKMGIKVVSVIPDED